MATIPIDNETEYALTDTMRNEILRDTHEHFGSDVRLIRVQVGLSRHTFNARTREVRYAFSPQDFGLGGNTPYVPQPSTEAVVKPIWGRRIRRRAVPTPFEESVEDDDETYHAEDRTVEKSLLASAEEGRDAEASLS
ncbi:MAG: hypothetical protein AB7N91_21515 [Candidatus Tectimicrobiota bacterium]